MNRIVALIAAAAVIGGVSPVAEGQNETSIRSGRVSQITELSSQGQFAAALDSSRALVRSEPANPVGYFLLATTYYTINNQFRNDHYADSVSVCVDTAIALAKKRTDNGQSKAE